jgi:hypothetical protein
MNNEIVNKVQQSGIITIDPQDYYPAEPCVEYDMAQNLWQGMVLKEKDFRQFIASHNWSDYQNKNVALYCSADAIIPHWAYMLLTNALSIYARKIIYGNKEQLITELMLEKIEKMDVSAFQDARVVIKGCSNTAIPAAVYVNLTQRLLPVVKTLMFGEPCSTVPVYKRK